MAQAFFKNITSETVTVLHDAECDKHQSKSFDPFVDPPEYSPKIESWKIEKISVSKNTKFMPQSSKFNEPSNSMLI